MNSKTCHTSARQSPVDGNRINLSRGDSQDGGQRSSAQTVSTEQVPSTGRKATKFTPFDAGIGGLGKLIDLNSILNQRGIRSANPIASRWPVTPTSIKADLAAMASSISVQHIPHEHGEVFTSSVPFMDPARSLAGGVE